MDKAARYVFCIFLLSQICRALTISGRWSKWQGKQILPIQDYWMIHNNWLNHPENNLNIIIRILSGHYLTFLRGNKTWHPPIWVLINCQGRIICLVLWKSPNARTVENVKSAYHHLSWGTAGDVIPTQANVKTYFWEIGQEMGKPIWGSSSYHD